MTKIPLGERPSELRECQMDRLKTDFHGFRPMSYSKRLLGRNDLAKWVG
jgi:hypothetical protein